MCLLTGEPYEPQNGGLVRAIKEPSAAGYDDVELARLRPLGRLVRRAEAGHALLRRLPRELR